ncbi:DUF4390 domain-containing protein [Noviherbaspirillum sedimenti]|uniref:DUF4390 domain-containing protein n=2 Tax=Noviherbaspirillum sedimenti TaxID=2320865 RepID=A0A3A3GTZ2_9BURK|nr:DUF4390 domain-containing protein [Noviherbaspirillum sedimenti]RJG04480.1 DUF4390 domain-containing protein [Noviherbaspirillum sedimenti]
MLAAPAVHAAEIEIQQAQLIATEEDYRLASSFSFELKRVLEDALNRGVPLYFTTDVELNRPRWYWFDENTVSASHTIRLSYNVLTRQYYATVEGSLRQGFSSLDDVLALVRRPARWLVADKETLKAGANYQVKVRMRLDVTQLPKPFQVNAINDSDWHLSSSWKTFTYKAE